MKSLNSKKREVVTQLKKIAVLFLEGIEASAYALYNHWIIFTILLLSGFLLIEMRKYALVSVPWAQRHVGLVTDAVDLFLLIFTAIDDIVRIIVGAVRALIHLFRPHKPMPRMPLKTYHPIRDSTVSADLSLFAETCPQFDSGTAVMQQLAKYVTQDNLCPVVRSLEVTALQPTTHFLLGWAVFNPDPYSTTSCQPDVSASIEWTCIGVAVGFIIVEIIIPVWALLLIFPKFWPAFDKFVLLLSNVV